MAAGYFQQLQQRPTFNGKRSASSTFPGVKSLLRIISSDIGRLVADHFNHNLCTGLQRTTGCNSLAASDHSQTCAFSPFILTFNYRCPQRQRPFLRKCWPTFLSSWTNGHSMTSYALVKLSMPSRCSLYLFYAFSWRVLRRGALQDGLPGALGGAAVCTFSLLSLYMTLVAVMLQDRGKWTGIEWHTAYLAKNLYRQAEKLDQSVIISG